MKSAHVFGIKRGLGVQKSPKITFRKVLKRQRHMVRRVDEFMGRKNVITNVDRQG